MIYNEILQLEIFFILHFYEYTKSDNIKLDNYLKPIQHFIFLEVTQTQCSPHPPQEKNIGTTDHR